METENQSIVLKLIKVQYEDIVYKKKYIDRYRVSHK